MANYNDGFTPEKNIPVIDDGKEFRRPENTQLVADGSYDDASFANVGYVSAPDELKDRIDSDLKKMFTGYESNGSIKDKMFIDGSGRVYVEGVMGKRILITKAADGEQVLRDEIALRK